MTLNQRRVLYIVFIFLFIIITPLVSLYASGYKFGSSFSLQKTGMLVIDTEPKGAKIYLNGKIEKNFFRSVLTSNQSLVTTPAKIKNLLPGEYDVKLETSGHWSWQKKLKIESGKTTFIEDIDLFKNDLPLIIKHDVYKNIILSPDKKNLLTLANKDIDLIRIENEEIITVATSSALASSTNDSKIAWSASGRWALAANNLINIQEPKKPQSIIKMLGQNISELKWDADDDNRLYYKKNKAVYYYDIFTKKSHLIRKNGNITEFISAGNYLYYIGRTNYTNSFNVWNINENSLIRTINIPFSSYSFLGTRNNIINLYDTSSNLLYIINPFAPIKPLVETIKSVKNARWIDDDKLLYSTDFEIWILDTRSGNKILLTRISNIIKDVFWHPNNKHVIFATSKNINILELDNREKYNITKLVELENISSPILTKEGDTLYFYSKIGNQEGLYKLAIQ